MSSDRSRHIIRLLALVAAAGLLLAACGDDSDSSGGGEGGGEAAGCEADVCMEGIAYTETEITVAAGDTVSWTNLDGVAHTVTAGTSSDPKPDDFDSGNVGEGESFDQTFDEAGEFAFFCTIHPQMEGTVTVE